jgi:hypothetical protein
MDTRNESSHWFLLTKIIVAALWPVSLRAEPLVCLIGIFAVHFTRRIFIELAYSHTQLESQLDELRRYSAEQDSALQQRDVFT